MSHMINIAEEGNNDAHYRYKREQLQLKVEGRGNGIKTVITNMGSVAQQLGVPPEYPSKYFGLECATQSKYDAKTARAVVNGKYELRDMEATLQQFIKKFVLCAKCKLPETNMYIEKDQLKTNCQACGTISTINPGEKLVTFILKHPPTHKKTGQASEGSSDDKKQTRDTAQPLLPSEEDVEWSEDTSQEAVDRRRKEEGLTTNIENLTTGGKNKEEEETVAEEEGSEISPVEVLKKFIDIKGSDSPVNALYAAVKKIQSEYQLGDREVVCLMYEALFTADIIEEKEIQHFAPLFRKFVKSSATSQKILLGYTEELVGSKYPQLLPSTSNILLEFYENDLLSEEVLKEWHGKKKSKFVKSATTVAKIKAASRPFINWLSAE